MELGTALLQPIDASVAYVACQLAQLGAGCVGLKEASFAAIIHALRQCAFFFTSLRKT
jgi:hypothetical protein